MENNKAFRKQVKEVYSIIVAMTTIITAIIVICFLYISNPELFANNSTIESNYVTKDIEDEDRIENGIHVRTGLIDDDGLMTVVNNCTNCHSAKLVTQNRMNKEQWLATIKWMQKTQNLWDLGTNEAIIVAYLAKNYAPKSKGRRENLSDIEWYTLNQ